MIVHGIDMTKVNTPEVSKEYENKMRELIPFKNKWFVDPFGRNLNVKITDKRIVYDPRSLGTANNEADKNSKKYMRRVEVIDKIKRLEAEVKRKEFKISELKKEEYFKAEKEGLIVPMKIDNEGYPYVELETEEK